MTKQAQLALTLLKNKGIKLESLKERISAGPLSFASKNDLPRILKLTKGAVMVI